MNSTQSTNYTSMFYILSWVCCTAFVIVYLILVGKQGEANYGKPYVPGRWLPGWWTNICRQWRDRAGRVDQSWDTTGAEAGRWWPEPADSLPFCSYPCRQQHCHIASQHTCHNQSSLKPSLGKIFLSKYQQIFQNMHGF